jgi:hypothetical protein
MKILLIVGIIVACILIGFIAHKISEAISRSKEMKAAVKRNNGSKVKVNNNEKAE